MKLAHLAIAGGIVLAAVVSAGAQEQLSEFPSTSENPLISDCTLAAAADIQISSGEAGLLVEFGMRLGDRVEEDQVLGRVDDDEVQMQRKVADIEKRAAYERAQNDIDARYSRAAHEVSKKEHELLVEADRKQPRSVTFVELERARLETVRAGLATEKAIHDRTLAKYDYYSKKAQLEAAEMAIERREIQAPSKGEVVELFREEGEWVNPGDAVLRLVRLDTLYVEGKLNIERYDPSQVLGCKVTVEAVVGGGRKAQTEGRLVWVSPIVTWWGDQTFVREIRAEIPNALENGEWRMHPGAEASMIIHLGTADVRLSRHGQ